MPDLLHDIFDNVFYDVAAMLIIAAIVGAVAVRLRQPLIVAFIAVGILVGSVLGWIEPGEPVDLLAEMGIALLLFIVGLKLDLHLIRTMGPVALATGLGQVLFTSIGGFLIALALGFDPVAALYIAIALTFSSTIIIVKLLSDKREIDSLHGRIAVGLLIVQDIVVVIVMIALTAFGEGGEGTDLGWRLFRVAVQGAAFLAAIALLMRYVLPPLLRRLAASPELLVLFSIAWAVFLAATGDFLEFSKEIGAFLAGVSLGSTRYRETIGARLTSVRDFLLLFFFISLGANLDLELLGEKLGAGIIFSLFVLIGNPLILMVIIGVMGYRKRTGFLTGLTVAQISEFSLIFAGLGLSLGHIGPDTLGLITLVGLITISISTYMILYSHPLYERLAPWLSIFERDIEHPEDEGEREEPGAEVIIFGLGRYGSRIAAGLKERGVSLLGVDFDPEAVERWHEKGLPAHYGDAEDPEFPAALPLSKARCVISSVRERSVNLVLLEALREHGFEGKIALTAANEEDARALEKAGADLVFRPYADAADRAVEVLTGA
nr:cation:proton antiporter [Rubrobacter taiwanensis]